MVFERAQRHLFMTLNHVQDLNFKFMLKFSALFESIRAILMARCQFFSVFLKNILEAWRIDERRNPSILVRIFVWQDGAADYVDPS